MSKPQLPFSLYKRKVGKKTIYYYKVPIYIDGVKKYIKRSTNQTTKSNANLYCYDLMSKGLLVPKDYKESKTILFKTFASNFYIESDYLKKQIALGKPIKESTCKVKQSIINSNILPFFGNIELKKITTDNIQDWLIGLNGLESSKDNCYKVLKTIFNYAIEKKLISESPCKVLNRKEHKARKKTLLNEIELKSVLEVDTWEIESLNNSTTKSIVFALNFIASKTGMRIGELQALQIEDITKDSIDISKTYSLGKLTPPKTNSSNRVIPIYKKTYDVLKKIVGNRKSGFIFSVDGIKPISESTIILYTNNVYTKLGIDYKSRRLTFHCWRHHVNTYLQDMNVSRTYIQRLLGHENKDMTDNYTQSDFDKLYKLLKPYLNI